MKSETKDLILKTACKPFGFRYETLHPDLSGIEDFQSLKTRGKELMETVNGPQTGQGAHDLYPVRRYPGHHA
jgi:hypothetical protein